VSKRTWLEAFMLVMVAAGVSSPHIAAAANLRVAAGQPNWSITMGAGYFAPAIDGWKNQYGKSGGWIPYLAGSYRLVPHLAVVADAARHT